MNTAERTAFRFLLVVDSLAIIISMFAGPLGNVSLALGAAGAALIISLSLIFYTLHFLWHKR